MFAFIKKHRLLTVLLSILILILIGVSAIGIWYICSVNTVNYVDQKRGYFVTDDKMTEGQVQELEENLESQGYYAYMPTFSHPISDGNIKFYKVYSAINTYLQDYVRDNVSKYNNCLKLDYKTDIAENKTLTVTFSGTGYSDNGEGKPEPLDKTFVFDISEINASDPEKLPVLVNES